jgi:hypothetical protein
MSYKYENIVTFLTSRGWSLKEHSNLFHLYSPPSELFLPEDYLLEIPSDPKAKGFDYYINSILNIISDIYENSLSTDDLDAIFNTNSSILSFRIMDEDTENGSIKFERFSNSIDSFRKIFSQATTFVSSKKPIFGNAEFEAENFLQRCRTLQTQKGSFITKFEIIDIPILSLYNRIETHEINTKLFEIIDFLNQEVFKNQQIHTVDKNYVESNIEYINVELFSAIKELYNKAKINNAEYALNNYNTSKYIETYRILPKINYFNKYIQNIKEVLLELVPLEAVGFIKKLSSISPQTSDKNEVIIESTIANKTEIIKVILDSEKYIQAIEAHKNELKVRIKGFATERKTQYTIKELESFEILPPTRG